MSHLYVAEMDNLVAIDVETANNEPSSICSIAAVQVTDGCITGRFYELVCPEPNWYIPYFTNSIHGISRKDTDNARCFADVWADLSELIGNRPLVAHNKSFDQRCIKAAFKTYQLDYPDYQFFCTLDKARRTIPRSICASKSLPALCEFLGIPFNNHHNALADAEACAKIAMTLL